MNEVHSGKIIDWYADKGFGFLKLGRERVFLHISDLMVRNDRPKRGDLVRFRLGRDRKGRSCAVEAVLKPIPVSQTEASRAVRGGLSWFDGVTVLGLLVLPAIAVASFEIRWQNVVAWIGLMSLLAVMACRYDKFRAREGGWRVSEMRLHLLELLGGWPGALLAQRYFRHKTVKLGYQIPFWFIVLAYEFVAFDSLNSWRICRAIGYGLPRF